MRNDAGELVLTRTVLLEKHIWFNHFDSPFKVPEFVWVKAAKELAKCLIEEKVDYIAKNILGLLLKETNYEIGPKIYDPDTFVPIQRVWFKNNSFDLNFELSMELRSYEWELLKKYVESAWGKNHIRLTMLRLM